LQAFLPLASSLVIVPGKTPHNTLVTSSLCDLHRVTSSEGSATKATPISSFPKSARDDRFRVVESNSED